eukprot:CFRG6760T1
MSTLEETVLRDELGRENGIISGSEDEDDNDESIVVGGPETMPTKAQYQSGQAQTGPKGVLADYKQFCREKANDKRQKEAELIAQAKKMSLHKTVDSDSDDFLDEDDELFLSQYRLRRMAEMQNLVNSNRPKFGYCRTVTQETFLSEIDDEDSNVYIVTHLFKESIGVCVRMNMILDKLAQRYTYVKFLKADAFELSKKFSSDKGLPALLVYQGGNLALNLVAVMDTIGTDFELTDVEELLANNRIITRVRAVENIQNVRDDE